MIRVAIVDDEPMARRIVRRHLRDEADVEIVGECGNGDDAVALINQTSPDLVFLDVQMPGMSGFDVLTAIPPDRVPAVVFVTAYEQHALKAFERHALDYLLKPFDRKRLLDALAHVRSQLARRAPGGTVGELTELLAEFRSKKRSLTRLSVRTDDRVVIVPLQTVTLFESHGNYVRIHAGGRTHLYRETLEHLESRLDPDAFVRIHRSYIVPLGEIRELQRWFHRGFLVVLRDGRKLKVGRSHADRLRSLL